MSFAVGARVLVAKSGEPKPAVVAASSDRGRALFLAFDGPVRIGGYQVTIGVDVQQLDDGAWIVSLSGEPVTITLEGLQ